MKTEAEIKAGILVIWTRLKAIPEDGTEDNLRAAMAATAVIDGLMWALGMRSVVGDRIDEEIATIKQAARAREN